MTAVTGKLQASKMQHEQQWQTAYDQMMAAVAKQQYDNSFKGQFLNEVSAEWNDAVAKVEGGLQGGLNLLVVAGNTVVGLGNLAIWTSPAYWIGRQFGLSLSIPSIPSARGVIVTESNWEYNVSWYLQQGGVQLVTLPLFGSSRLAAESGTSLAQRLGQEGELAANIVKNTERIPSITGTAAYRTPDILDHVEQLIGDVKNVKRLSFDYQLQDSLYYALQNGYDFILIVRENTIFTSPLQALIDKEFVTILRNLPAR